VGGKLYLIDGRDLASGAWLGLSVPVIIDARSDADLTARCEEAGIGYHPIGDRLRRSEASVDAVLGEVVHLLAGGMAGLVADGYDAEPYCRPAALARRLDSLGVTVLDMSPDGSLTVHQPDFGF